MQSTNDAASRHRSGAPGAGALTMIYVGTCGFSYKDWIGPVYPARIKSTDMLPFYARRFAAVEIDSSAYGVPSGRTVESMVR
ncbi:MAG TPA: DUF72 domain-containing protein, partial [Candidatus Baltobacteraceae bacterium]|nr:DUF72 domain-containing protein [Candidatus Baltobacteraceae bacterium]